MDRLFDPERVLLPSAVQSLSGISEDEELPNPSSNPNPNPNPKRYR